MMRAWAGSVVISIFVASQPVSAQPLDIVIEARPYIQTGIFSFAHDASKFNPALGNPTSVLEYSPLEQAGIDFVITGRGTDLGDAWFDLIASLSLSATGSFSDRDFLAGQALMSHTASVAAMPFSLDLTARIGLPVEPLNPTGMPLRPYAVGTVGTLELAAMGLDCAACVAPLLPSDVAVIGHRLTGGEFGFGVWLEQKLEAGWYLDVRGEIRAGYTHVQDSHHFRPDLGPTPNIIYDLLTMSGQGEVALRTNVSENVEFTATAFANATYGFGNVAFGGIAGNFPADMRKMSAGISLGLSVGF